MNQVRVRRRLATANDKTYPRKHVFPTLYPADGNLERGYAAGGGVRGEVGIGRGRRGAGTAQLHASDSALQLQVSLSSLFFERFPRLHGILQTVLHEDPVKIMYVITRYGLGC